MKRLSLGALLIACAPASSPGAPAGPSLTSFDCGRIEVNDMGFFSATGATTGAPGVLVVPCFVVRHPRGTLVWDTGLSDAIATAPTADLVGNRETVSVPLRAQLASAGLDRVDFVAFSHLHADHAGNANLFSRSTWLLDRREIDWATAAPPGVDPSAFSGYRSANVRYLVDEDVDLFGDGTVRLLRAPGHTPGHRVLVVRLAHAGTVVLSGDLAHTRANWDAGVVPHFNVDHDATVDSMQRIRDLVASSHGRLVVEHDPADFATLPRWPAWLE